MPMDHAVYDEWYKKSNYIETTGDLKIAAIEFLESYERRYHFNFGETKNILRELSDEKINDIISMVKE